jgi:hypothetical protein
VSHASIRQTEPGPPLIQMAFVRNNQEQMWPLIREKAQNVDFSIRSWLNVHSTATDRKVSCLCGTYSLPKLIIEVRRSRDVPGFCSKPMGWEPQEECVHAREPTLGNVQTHPSPILARRTIEEAGKCFSKKN